MGQVTGPVPIPIFAENLGVHFVKMDVSNFINIDEYILFQSFSLEKHDYFGFLVIILSLAELNLLDLSRYIQ